MFAVGTITCPAILAEYLLIWQRKKGGRPIARDYTDLRAHSYAHLLAHLCTLRNAKLSATHLLVLWGGSRSVRHRDISLSKFISPCYELRKFQETLPALLRGGLNPQKKKKAACITLSGLICRRRVNIIHLCVERSQHFIYGALKRAVGAGCVYLTVRGDVFLERLC